MSPATPGDTRQPLKWFREASPYINAHRQGTFVLMLGIAALRSENFANVVADIALLNSLGIRIVIVFGLERESAAAGGAPITTPEHLGSYLADAGRIRSEIEAQFSIGVINSPLHGAAIEVVSGNFVKARPLGIVDGVDHHHTGEVRRINVNTIRAHLDESRLVLLPPFGYSATGDIFTLDPAVLARDAATALNADKLVYFIPGEGLMDGDAVISELQTDQLEGIDGGDNAGLLPLLKTACERGVKRCHLVSHETDGALLEELFTRDGAGTQIVLRSYEQVRKARADDVAAILQLIEPLQLEGILVTRSKELIESEIEHFTVIERDGSIISCAALYPFADQGELACLATHPDYRDGDRGETLLKAIVGEARDLGLSSLFVLTTRASHWFRERGFVASDPERLPATRRENYNLSRNSQVLQHPLT